MSRHVPLCALNPHVSHNFHCAAVYFLRVCKLKMVFVRLIKSHEARHDSPFDILFTCERFDIIYVYSSLLEP